jgi:light-regulated signal transduction histidine kinase (bacteriophytochrome)
MKVTVVWHTPMPERAIAIAMRRCYSTKPIEEIENELEQKGIEYWKYLIVRALQDKSLDVIEHYYLELLIDDLDPVEVSKISNRFKFMSFLQLDKQSWLVSMNARTLVEMWREDDFKNFARLIVEELNIKDVGKVFNSLAFGE